MRECTENRGFSIWEYLIMVDMKNVVQQLNTSWYTAIVKKFPKLKSNVSVMEDNEKTLKLPAARIFQMGNPSLESAMDLEGTENAVTFTVQVEFYEGASTWSTLYDYDKTSHEFFEHEGYERIFGLEFERKSNVVRSICRYRKTITAEDVASALTVKD